jgi:ribA/ribD-fused uncharacterized protein
VKIDKFSGEYAFLSNFYPSVVVGLDGETYSSVEHAYQAAKTLDVRAQRTIREAPTAGVAKKLGRKVILREDWERLKLPTMGFLVRQKFREPKLMELLVKTGDAELIEGNWWRDTFWGMYNGKGENHLGKILMRVRDEV